MSPMPWHLVPRYFDTVGKGGQARRMVLARCPGCGELHTKETGRDKTRVRFQPPCGAPAMTLHMRASAAS